MQRPYSLKREAAAADCPATYEAAAYPAGLVPRPPLRAGDLLIDLEHRHVTRRGKAVRLSRIEWALLDVLVRNAGRTLPHRALLRQVWGDSYSEELNYLHTYFSRLRAKLEDDPAAPRHLLTLPRLGYRFVLPEACSAAGAPAPPLAEPPALELPLPLPQPPSSFVQRPRELAALHALLRQPSARLITLLGAPGSGKTRLALRLAAQLAQDLQHAVAFVDLAQLDAPQQLPLAIAQALGARGAPGQPIGAALEAYLAPRRLLIILDTCEHLQAAAPWIDELLAAAPGLRLLATSRLALRLPGEHCYQLPPLDLPAGGWLLCQPPSLEVAGTCAAVQLFVQRARAARPGFALAPGNLQAVVEICRRLEGLPLAIELAAAWAGQLAPQAMLDRLDELLQLPAPGRAGQPSLRAAVERSYALLDPYSQSLFCQLGLLAGSFTPEQARGPGARAWRGRARDVEEGLRRLLEHSLIDELPSGRASELRLAMLEPIRACALAMLREQDVRTLR